MNSPKTFVMTICYDDLYVVANDNASSDQIRQNGNISKRAPPKSTEGDQSSQALVGATRILNSGIAGTANRPAMQQHACFRMLLTTSIGSSVLRVISLDLNLILCGGYTSENADQVNR